MRNDEDEVPFQICAAQLSKIREAQASKRRANVAGLKMYNRPEAVFREFNALVGGDDEVRKEEEGERGRKEGIRLTDHPRDITMIPITDRRSVL